MVKKEQETRQMELFESEFPSVPFSKYSRELVKKKTVFKEID